MSTRNITKAFRLANWVERGEGFDWYRRANELAVDLWWQYEREESRDDAVDRACAVIAVLSPRRSWPQNVILARRAYDLFHSQVGDPEFTVERFTDQMRCLGDHASKAYRILSGELPDSVVGGPKVRAFWATIKDPDSPDLVVIDRHAYDVSVGHVTSDAVRGRALGKVGTYEAICEEYRRAAKILSRELGRTVPPCEVQATTWIYWRNNRAKANHG